MDSDSVDVLVVGGGPAGLAAAQTAARSGHVMTIEKEDEIGRPVRTSGGSWMRHLEELKIPSDCYRQIQSLVVSGPNTRQVVRFGDDVPVVLDVTRTYQHLAGLAKECGAEIRTNTKFVRVLGNQSDLVCCEIAQEGRLHAIKARFVIDASGHHRAVLRSAKGESRFERVGVGAEFEFRRSSDREDPCVLFVGEKVAPSGYGWIFPAPNDQLRVGIGVIRPDSNESPSNLLRHFLTSPLAQELDLRESDLIESHFGVIPAKGVASEFVFDRVLGVGDSVGHALPLVGEGIRFAIEAGRRAGNAVADALGGRDPVSSFRDYERWWMNKYRRRFDLAQVLNLRKRSTLT